MKYCCLVIILVGMVLGGCAANRTTLPSAPNSAPLRTPAIVGLPALTPAARPDAPPFNACTSTPASMAPSSAAYLTEALRIMQEHSINRAAVDWAALCATAWSLADGAQAPADTYYAIQFALAALGDRHSFFMQPDEVMALQSGALDAANQQPAGEVLAQKIGYVRLPAFDGSEQAATAYATKVQAILRQLDSGNICGWIVDLADNRGGNMWPMVAGIGPLLDGEIIGAFVDPDGQKQPWFYRNGQAGVGTQVFIQVPSPAYRLKRPQPAVAVLTRSATASSGEAIAVAFRGRPRTRSFGTPTAGLSTGNAPHRLSDGAALILTEVTFADRMGRQYGKEVLPDTQVVGPDQARQVALDWLLGQDTCTLDAFVGYQDFAAGLPDKVWLNDGTGMFQNSGQSSSHHPKLV